MTAQFNEQQLKNQNARQAALTALSRPENLAAPSIAYHSGGHLLIIGADDLARLAALQLLRNKESGVASLSLLITDPVQDMNNSLLEQALTDTQQLPVAYGTIESVEGYLGQFELTVKPTQVVDPLQAVGTQQAVGSQASSEQPDQESASEKTVAEHALAAIELVSLAPALIQRSHYDLILDLGREPALAQELSPPGYFHVAPGNSQLQQVLSDLPDMVGEFEKPLYFRINTDICAHSSRGLTGCTRCLDVCPADAISSIEKQIEVDSHLCHGAGSCSTACPTGAISYAMPKSSMMADYMTRLLQMYRDQGGLNPVIVLHGEETGIDQANLAPNLMPVALEEVANLGIELWMHMFSQGCQQIILLTDSNTPDSLIQLLNREIQLSQQLLESLGYSKTAIQLVSDNQQLSTSEFVTDDGVQVPANIHINYSSQFEEPSKRDRLLGSLNHLHQFADVQPLEVSLNSSAPFGQISIDSNSCTMCMSCAAVCPTGSISTEENTPVLNFLEADCVQCGLCEAACPENSITREQRFVFDRNVRDEKRVINKDEPFCCIDCGKPFAPTSTVNMMKEKLKGHSMFAGDAIKRLERCEDCRVKDIYRGLAADPSAQLNL